jgi:hypothetical protein
VPPPDPARAALLAVAGELARLHDTAAGLQDALPAAAEASARQALQRLDALTQALDALAAFAGEVGGGASPAEAAARLPLAALADRLAGGAGADAPSGDLELF